VAELFSFEKALTGVFNLLPRTGITRAIWEEQRFQMTGGMTDPDTIAALGKQAGAQYVLSGSITSLGDRKVLLIGVLKIDDLRQIAGDVTTYSSIEDIRGKLPDMARTIAASAVRADRDALPRLALPPVALAGGADPGAADILAQALAAYLIQGGKYAVYPRTASLEQIQQEYANQLKGDTAEEQLPDLGRGTNPERVLSVSARKLGRENMFNAAILNLVSGLMEAGETVDYGTLDDGLGVMEELAAVLGGNKLSAFDGAAFERALAAANTGTGRSYVIILEGSFALNPVILSAGRRIILKGDGKARTITSDGKGVLFTVPATAALILEDGLTLDGNRNGWRIVAVDGGDLVMKDGSTLRGSTWGGVLVKEGGRFTLEGGRISGNTADGGNGGGVAVNPGGSFTMSGGTISDNTAVKKNDSGGNCGGVLVSSGGSFAMTGGTISGNTGLQGGGVEAYGSFTMSAGTISGNTADSYGGGGVMVNSGCTFIMAGGTISGNTGSWGGGVAVYSGGSFTMSSGTISGNMAVKKNDSGGNGGGVGVNPGCSFTMAGGRISGNTGIWGGGVQVWGNFVMSGGTISGNTADSYGGGVHVNTRDGGSFVKTGGTIDGTNQAEVVKAAYVYINENKNQRRNSAGGAGGKAGQPYRRQGGGLGVR
jgi:hypothetical protein